MSESIQRTKLCEDVEQRIVEYIRTERWAAGAKIPSELDLALQLDVSRTTIRSAIKNLQHAGVLYSRSGSGTYVSDTASFILESKELACVSADPQTIHSLIQARYILEPQLAALASKNATDDEIQCLFDIIQAMRNHPDKHSLILNGHRFHQCVAQFSHNNILFDFFQSAAQQLRGLRVIDSLTVDTFLEGIDEHQLIANAIRDRDPALAKQLMRSHLKKDYAAYLAQPEFLE